MSGLQSPVKPEMWAAREILDFTTQLRILALFLMSRSLRHHKGHSFCFFPGQHSNNTLLVPKVRQPSFLLHCILSDATWVCSDIYIFQIQKTSIDADFLARSQANLIIFKRRQAVYEGSEVLQLPLERAEKG